MGFCKERGEKNKIKGKRKIGRRIFSVLTNFVFKKYFSMLENFFWRILKERKGWRSFGIFEREIIFGFFFSKNSSDYFSLSLWVQKIFFQFFSSFIFSKSSNNSPRIFSKVRLFKTHIKKIFNGKWWEKFQ